MTIKEIIICAFKLLGRDDIVQTLLSGAAPEGECAEKTDIMLYCVNAVEDELTRYYFPVKRTDEISSADGVFAFEKFTERPVKILSVKADGKNINYSLFPQYFRCGKNTVTVEYEYVPQKKTFDQNSVFDGSAVCEKLIAAGAAAEYCLIAGSVKLCEMWESRYREEIDLVRGKFHTHAHIPPRRWV